MKIIPHWIAGQAEAGQSTRRDRVWNPATGEQIAEVVLATAHDVNLAVEAARTAVGGWMQASLGRRAAVLFAFRDLVVQHREELARLVSEEHGKAIADASAEVQRGLEVVEYACGIPELLKGAYSDQVSTGVDMYTYRQPLGVVAGITPFNFPVMVPLWMHPIAIACGNAFILKPSERDPSPSVFMAQLWAEAGLPAGVFNVVQGDKEAVDAILDNPDIAAVSFVGSTPVARYVYQRASMAGKRVQALGGAKNHAVIMPDADWPTTAAHVVGGAFGSTGQRCMAVAVMVAVGDGADQMTHAVASRAAKLRVGPGLDPDTEMGPVITAAARRRVIQAIDAAERDGAEVVLDGRCLSVNGHERGFFIGPTVIDRVQPEMSVYREEIFGPVLSVVRVPTLDAAIELVNRNPFGNGAVIFTQSGSAAREFQRRINAGMVGINVPVPVPMAYHSFGGWKGSLFGDRHVHGPDGVGFYTRSKVVTVRWDRALPEG